jgi:tetratricopeptide (TPR) repeat protein
MDDCDALEQILNVARKALTELELQAAMHTESTIPVPLKLQRNEKREEVTQLEARLEAAKLAKQGFLKAPQSDIHRQSIMRLRVPDENYIERNEAKRLLERFEIALQQPQGNPLLFNICGIGGVGKTTLLGRLQEAHKDEVDFLEVCFTKTPGLETPLKLMRKLHQLAMEFLGTETSEDSFTLRDQQFEDALYKLSQSSVDGTKTSSEEERKIRSWFERLIWLGPMGLTSTSSKPKSFDISGTGFSTSSTIGEDSESLKEWIQQRVRYHPATKDQPELQMLMLEPVSKLTQAFAESLMHITQRRNRSLVLVLDTYEKAQAYLNQWLWQYLVEDTPLYSVPVRLVVVGRRSLQADEGWRKLNQDRKLLYEAQLKKFSKPDTDTYLQKIGIENGGKRAKIFKATQGLPYYLDWVRKQREQDQEPDFSKGNQAIAELLLQGIDSQQRKILQVVACCRWFDLEMICHLLGNGALGLNLNAANVEDCFEWLKRSDFVEFTKGHYCLDDVARDVFRQSYFQDGQNKFRKTHALLADYFKKQADEVVDPQSLLPDSYKDEQWRELIAEFLYYGLFGNGKEGLRQYIEHVFAAVYLREPEVFMVPFAFIRAEISTENEHLLPKETDKFFEESAIVLAMGWLFLDKNPKSYKIKFKGENTHSDKSIEEVSKQIEGSIQSLLGHIGDFETSFGKCVGLIYRSLRCNIFKQKTDSLLQAKRQIEQLLDHFNLKLIFSLFSTLGDLLGNVELYEHSLDCYHAALESGHGNASTLRGKGDALFELERYIEAFESYKKAIKLDPKSPNAWNAQGYVLSALNRYEESLDACNRAFDLDSQNYDMLNNKALTLSHLKHFEQAIAIIDAAIQLKPQATLLRANRGIILARYGQNTEALTDCEQSIKEAPDHEGGYYGKACCYALQGEIDMVIYNLKKAINIAPHRSRREAKHNPDFDNIRDDQRFRALVYLDPES